ncbi:transglutaminase domain-containing protein [Lysinibacillus sp. NPDC048646]|uniref:transglutaminase domain-containing protein n=1 Tax=Lysinibacillus sp. NPDC048646 TaxID=3390574 RepID=UPI003D04A0AA
MKNKISLLLFLCMISILVACADDVDTTLAGEIEVEDLPVTDESTGELKQPESKALSTTISTTDLFSTTLYDEDPALLQFIKKIEKHIAKFDQNFEVTYTGKLKGEDFEQQLNDMTSLLSYVNPYTAGYFLDYEWTYWEEDKKFSVEFNITYLTDAKKEAQIDAYVKEFVHTYISNDMNDFERAKAVNDYVVLLATYTEDGATEGQTVYELIQDGTGVCQAYALLAYRLFLAAGLEADYVYGYSDDELHAWNLVNVDGDWYHVDTTWNDVDASEPYTVSYEYFLLNDEKLRSDHLWQTENYHAATSDAYAFMHDMWYADTVNNVIYYNGIQDGKVYKYDLTTSVHQQITETSCYYLAVHHDAIYCSDYDNGGYLTKILSSDGSEEVLLEQEVLNLHTKNDVLYYETIDGEVMEQGL